MLAHRTIEPYASGGIADLELIELQDGTPALLRRLKSRKVLKLSQHWGFLRGMRIRKAVTPHPNIVASLDSGYDFTRPYEIIEYVAGENLAEMYNRQDEYLLDHLAEVLTDCANGLAWVHKCGFMHLDVKPENFICQFGERRVVKLTDFDLARPVEEHQRRPQMGTLAYMAPEQMRHKVGTRASDVFSFAVLSYLLFTGKHPFAGGGRHTTLRNQSSDTFRPRPPVELNPDIPPKWNCAIVKGLEKQPRLRIPNMSEWMNELV